MRLDFRRIREAGVQDRSSGYLFTPLPYAKELYFYITQIGHYYCTHSYAIRRDYFSPILVLCVKAGCLHVDYRRESYRLQTGGAMLIDCREPHYYYADKDGLEFYYLHFEGSNSHEICQRILSLKGPLVQKHDAALLADRVENAMRFYDEGKTENEFAVCMADNRFNCYSMFTYCNFCNELFWTNHKKPSGTNKKSRFIHFCKSI